MTLKVAAIRGVESNGMMCSLRELELGEEHDGIVELPADAPVGTAYADYAGLDDPLFDVAITPNRQDCMGVRGIARDLAAFGLGTLKPLAQVYRMASLDPIAGDGPAPDVRTDDPEGCPAFFAQAVSGVTNGAAPDVDGGASSRRSGRSRSRCWSTSPISSRSISAGRCTSMIAPSCRARWSRAARTDGEQVLALNGKTYTLDASMTVIADDVQVHDIGGIMGGEHSGVSETTTDVLIECAYFDPDHIALTGQKLGLTSDARQRFERGVDPAFLDDGLAIATKLVLDHCGGTPSAITRAGDAAAGAAHASPIDPRALPSSAGCDVPPTERAARRSSSRPRLRACRDDRRGPVTVPSWRRDIDGPADLVEEVIRIEGLDNVPADAAAARRGRRQADRDARAEDRAQGAPRRRRARLRRGGDVELPVRRRRPRRSAAAPGRSPIRSARI